MKVEIVLSRHGQPDIDVWAWVSPREIKEWIAAYDDAPVVLEQAQPAGRTAAASGILVCSPLRRSIESARALCPDKPYLAEDLFREAELPYGHWSLPKLPLVGWAIWLRLGWFLGYGQDIESVSLARLRAKRATERLVALAREHGSVFLVGHGILNMLIAEELLALGWSGPKRPASRYWQFSRYQSPP